MTLDETIKHAEEVAEEKESEAQDLEYSKLDWKYEANQCAECAKEHRQLAEWLRDYKRLKEQDPILDKIRAEIENHCGLLKENHCKYCSYCNSVMGVREILEIIDKYKEESEG